MHSNASLSVAFLIIAEYYLLYIGFICWLYLLYRVLVEYYDTFNYHNLQVRKEGCRQIFVLILSWSFSGWRWSHWWFSGSLWCSLLFYIYQQVGSLELFFINLNVTENFVWCIWNSVIRINPTVTVSLTGVWTGGLPSIPWIPAQVKNSS